MNKLGKGHWGLVTVCLVILLSFLLCKPPGAEAYHYPETGDDANCSSCHTLDASEGDANTSYISSNARTFPQIKAYDGQTPAPKYLGCTFCHYLNDNATMKPALGHFQGKLSFHPVGYNFNTHTNTNYEYVSGYGQTPGLTPDPLDPSQTPTTNQLDCVDCHDINLGKLDGAPSGYPDHSNRTGARANNYYMLKNITGPGEYDGLCRTCHRSDTTVTVKGVSMQLTKHADGAASRPLVEDDGTVLRTNDLNQDGIADASGIVDQCRVCHDTHYSAKYKLFSDGHEKHKVGAAEVDDTAIIGDGNNCTTVCHYPGDNNNLVSGGNFGKYGHGKTQSTYKYKNFAPDATGTYVTMGMNCASCHVALDISAKAHVEPVPSGANDREKYKSRFNLNISLQTGDDGSAYGNPIWGVCFQCHSGYEKHVGAGFNVGCQDCHDEHAEGSGTTSNVFMIPEKTKVEGTYIPSGTGTHTKTKVGTEAVTYDSPRFILGSNPYDPDDANEDFYRPGSGDAGDGVCDVQECHGAGRRLNTIMPAGQTHAIKSSSVQVPGADCEGCHQHNGDPGGGWRATASCGECHSYPGISTANSDHILSPVHDRHVNTIPAGYAFPCDACHFGNNHNGSNYANNSGWNNAAIAPNVNIRFDPARNPTNQTDYPRYNNQPASLVSAIGNGGTGTCAGLYCHGNNQSTQGAASNAEWAGLNETPNWGQGTQTCGSCHAATPATPTASQAHTKHVTTAGYACADCHGAVPSTDAVITHVNNQVTITSGLSYAGGIVVGDGDFSTCTTGSCHNAGTNIAWNTAATDCSSCHANASDTNNFVGNDRTASMISSTEYTATTTGGHGKTSGPSIGKTCATASCHDMSAGHDFTAGLTGANPYRLVDQVPGGSLDFSCSYTTGCHPAATAAPATGLTYGSIVTHSKEKMLNPGSYTAIRSWPTWKPRCTECHDPHGDGANLSMIQRELYDKGSAVQGVNTGSEDWGVHASPDAGTIVFTDNTTGVDTTVPYTSYADNGTFSSLCQECHEGVAPNQIVAFKDNTSASVPPHSATNDCSICHKHSEGFRPSGCASCHGNGANQFWPDGAGSVVTTYPDRGGKHALHIQRIGERLGYTGYPAYGSTQQQAICAYCHGVTFGESGHYDSDWQTAQLTRQPANVPTATAGTFFKQMWGAYADDAKTAAGSYVVPTYAGNIWNPGTAVCNNVDCHNEKSTATPYEWYGTGTTACVLCHADVTADVVGTGQTHVAHTSANTTYGITITCNSCHTAGLVFGTPGTPPTTAAGHIDGTFTVSGGSVSFTYSGATYPTVKGSCGANVCHNDGTGAAVVPVRNPYPWGTALTNDCASCHQGTLMATGKHTGHLGSNALTGANLTYNTADECVACHGTSTDGLGKAISGGAHLNGSVNVSFAAAYDYEAAGGTGTTGTGAALTCAGIRCHNGVTTPAWGAAGISCGQCHGDGVGTPNSEPAPTMSASVSGNHAKHHYGTPTDFTDCDQCHGATGVTVSGTYTATGGGGAGLLHQNLAVDMWINGANNRYVDANGKGGVDYAATDFTDNGTCTATICHSSGAPVWGGTLANGCFDCHTGSEVASKPLADTIPNPVDQTQYTTQGHGRTGSNYPGSGNAPAGFAYDGATNNCYNCHSITASHSPAASGTDPFRLGVTYATNTDGLCLTCHGTGGSAVKKDEQTHSQAVLGAKYTWPGSSYAFKCVDCHDPHGDANYQMVRSSLSAPQTTGDTSFGSDTYGTPADAANMQAVTFTNMTGMAADSYGITGTGSDGICEVCHTQTTEWRKDLALETHNPAVKCTNCHDHKQGLKAACAGCHGDGVSEYWPQNATNLRTTNTYASFNDDGRHTQHMTVLAARIGFTLPGTDAQQRAACAYCHVLDDYDHTSVTNVTQAEVFVSNAVRGAKSLWNAADGDAAFTAGSAYSCQTVDCHNNKDTGATYNWYTGAASACAMCHVDVTNGTADPNAHVSHTGSSAIYGRSIVCNDCHVTGVVWNTTAPATGHIDGSWTIQSLAVSYNGSWPATKGSCGTGGQNSCHTNGASGLPVTTAYSWGTALTNDCASCHQGTLMATGKHTGHLGSNALTGANLTYNTADECVACHGTSTDGLGKAISGGAHLNGSVNVSFAAAYDYEAAGGTGTTGTGAALTCAGIRCHNGVTTPAWGAAGISCGQCHGDGVGTPNSEPAPTMSASVSGNHAKHHYGTPTDFTDCDQCHGATGVTVSGTYTATGGGGAGLLHQNLAVDMWINGANNRYVDANGKGGVDYAATDFTDNGTCTATICHSSGAPVWGGTLANGCFDCHTGSEVASKPLADTIPNPVDQTQYTTQGHGRTGSNYPGSGNAPAGFAYDGATNNCYNCHSITASHSPAASGTDPFRLGVTYATNTDGLCLTCHGTGGSAVKKDEQTHSQAVLGAKYTWPGSSYAFKCVDCHDPHGDANYQMVRSSLSAPQTTGDTSFGSDTYGTPADAANMQAVTFTNMTGMAADSYGITGTGSDGICEVCHTQTTYWRKDVAQEGHNPTTKCTNCHNHTQGLAAGACESCHNGVSPARKDGTGDQAPNVMGPGTSTTGTGSTPKPYDNGSWGFNVNGHGANGTANTKVDIDLDPGITTYLQPNAACTDCHALQSHHYDGVLNSYRTPSSVKENTYHLKDQTAGLNPFVNTTNSDNYSIQIAFDNACWKRCHQTWLGDYPVTNMRHWGKLRGALPTYVSEFGQQGSIPDGDVLSWPIDSDISTDASTAAPDYLPCSTCHDVHGTNVTITGYPTNRMMRLNSKDSAYCLTCHP